MSDRDAFLRAIIASPDDDLPRLIFADWLDELGDQQGEFIRVQCELSLCPPAIRVDRRWGDHRYAMPEPWDTLCRRELELMQFAESWLWDIGPTTIETWYPAYDGIFVSPGLGWEVQFRRGFVEKLTCTAADWLRHADAITARTPIREVVLTTWPEWPQFGYGVRRMGQMAQLGVLDSRLMPDQLAADWPGIRFTLPTIHQSPVGPHWHTFNEASERIRERILDSMRIPESLFRPTVSTTHSPAETP